MGDVLRDAVGFDEWRDIESDAWDIVSQFPSEGTVALVCNELEERYGIRYATSETRLLAAMAQEVADMLAEKRIADNTKEVRDG